jgi:hypothetical protein
LLDWRSLSAAVFAAAGLGEGTVIRFWWWASAMLKHEIVAAVYHTT